MNQHFNEWRPETNANENVEGHSDKLENIGMFLVILKATCIMDS